MAGAGLIDDAQRHRRIASGAAGVRGADGEAVHRRAIEGGHVIAGGHILGEHPPERRPQLDRFTSERHDALEDQAPGLFDLDHLHRHLGDQSTWQTPWHE